MEVLEYAEKRLARLYKKEKHTIDEHNIDSDEILMMAKTEASETGDCSAWVTMTKLHDLRLELSSKLLNENITFRTGKCPGTVYILPKNLTLDRWM